MDNIVRELAKYLGVDPTVVESTLVSVMFVIVLWLLKLLYEASKRDDKQLVLEQTLAKIAADSIAESRLLRQAFDNNATALACLTADIKTSFGALVEELKTVVQGISGIKLEIQEQSTEAAAILKELQGNLLKTSETTVVVKDSEDNIIAKFTATPENGVLVVRFSSTEEKENGTVGRDLHTQ